MTKPERIKGGPFDGLLRNGYGAILADPPWHFKTYNEKGRLKCPDWKPFKGAPEKHYATMSMEAIKALPVQDLAAPDCALFLWGIWPLLPDALSTMASWGFTYKTCAFDWLKTTNDWLRPRIGCGYWARLQTEFVLFGSIGRPKRLNADVRQSVVTPRREHSRKPNEIVRPRIEKLVKGPYLELFARESAPPWESWGNQTDKFDGKYGFLK